MQYVYLPVKNKSIYGGNQMKEFLLSPEGIFFILLFKMAMFSIFMCLSVHFFDFRNLSKFLTIKRMLSLFFLANALRMLWSSLIL
jgi:hypothetical protein